MPERYPTIYLRVQGGGGGCRRWWGGSVGIAREKARHGGAYRDGRGGGGPAVGSVFEAGGAAHRWPRAAGADVWPVVAGGSGGWRLKMNRRPMISYPTAAKSTDQR